MSAGNSAYSPLPQSNSDSDCSSEEELHVSQGNRIVNRAAKIQNAKDEKAIDEQKNNFINYKLLDNDGEVGVALNNFLSAPKEVSILKPDSGLEIFSTSRKICFLFSLLLCIFTTIAFVWILPCNVESCISASDVRNSNFTWEENLTNLEIYGPISLVSDTEKQYNLLFLTRSHLDSRKNYSENGLRCLKGKDGSLVWHFNLDEEATDIDCKLIDINTDGINDCLIYGAAFLNAVNPVSGTKLWDIQKSNKKEERLYFTDFPLVIPDLDKDEVKELLLPCSFVTIDKVNHPGFGFQNYLVIISGKTGTIINEPLQIKSCNSIHNLMFENSSVLSYTCFNSNKKESFQKISFTSILRSLKNLLKGITDFPKTDLLKQHVGDLDNIGVNGFRLILENQGYCPEDCDVLVYIKDEHPNSINKTVYHFKQKNTFGMAPVILKTKKEIGFILKFWTWESKAENSDFPNEAVLSAQKTGILKNNSKSLTKRSKKISNLLNNSKILDKEMLLESEWESQRLKRMTTKLHRSRIGKSALNSAIFDLHVITEIIVKIALNQSQIVVSNITKDEIVQICKRPHICQPNVHQQRHSILVAEFDEVRAEKLVTFTSKYFHKEKEGKKNLESWQLQSRIQVLNL